MGQHYALAQDIANEIQFQCIKKREQSVENVPDAAVCSHTKVAHKISANVLRTRCVRSIPIVLCYWQ